MRGQPRAATVGDAVCLSVDPPEAPSVFGAQPGWLREGPRRARIPSGRARRRRVGGRGGRVGRDRPPGPDWLHPMAPSPCLGSRGGRGFHRIACMRRMRFRGQRARGRKGPPRAPWLGFLVGGGILTLPVLEAGVGVLRRCPPRWSSPSPRLSLAFFFVFFFCVSFFFSFASSSFPPPFFFSTCPSWLPPRQRVNQLHLRGPETAKERQKRRLVCLPRWGWRPKTRTSPPPRPPLAPPLSSSPGRRPIHGPAWAGSTEASCGTRRPVDSLITHLSGPSSRRPGPSRGGRGGGGGGGGGSCLGRLGWLHGPLVRDQ